MNIRKIGRCGGVEVELTAEECRTLAEACRRHAMEVDDPLEEVRAKGLGVSFEALGMGAVILVEVVPFSAAREVPSFTVGLDPVEVEW